MGFSNYLVTKTGYLVRTFIRSPDFAAGSAGWTVNKDGSAEFNSVVIRNGEVVGGSALYYDPVPGPGTLVASVSATQFQDQYGNQVQAGVYSYGPGGLTGITGPGLLTLQNGSNPWQVQADPATGDLLIRFPHTGATMYVADSAGAGSIVPNQPGTSTPEAWHTAALANSFTQSGQPLKYTLLATEMVAYSGRILIPAGAGNSATVATGLYAPGRIEQVTCVESPTVSPFAATPHRAEVDTSGDITVFGAMASGASLSFSGAYPLSA